MTAEEAAREWLTKQGRRRDMDTSLTMERTDRDDLLALTTLILARERAARVEALRGAARDLDDMAARCFDGRTHEVVRLCARTVAARAKDEEQGT